MPDDKKEEQFELEDPIVPSNFFKYLSEKTGLNASTTKPEYQRNGDGEFLVHQTVFLDSYGNNVGNLYSRIDSNGRVRRCLYRGLLPIEKTTGVKNVSGQLVRISCIRTDGDEFEREDGWKNIPFP
jgi:hypothetical protein